MPELHIIELNSSNEAAFDAIAKQQAKKEDCDKLSDPRVQAEIQTFITSQRAMELSASLAAPIGDRQRHIFSHDSAVTTDLGALAVSKNSSRDTYIKTLHKLIIADITDAGKKVNITMDPLPIGKRLAIFFKAEPGDVWSIATAVSTPKADYIKGLLKHDDVPGLGAQMSIYEYDNGTTKTRILARRYMMEFRDPANPSKQIKPNQIQLTAMYVQHGDHWIETQHTPEDAFISTDKFQPVVAWKREQVRKYGRQTAHRFVRNANECDDFVNGDVHFTIYKTSHADSTGTITGQYLQTDNDGELQVQSRNASVVESKIDELLKQRAVFVLNTYVNHTPNAKAWADSGFKDVQQVNADTVKVKLNATSHIIETRSNLSLYGDANEEHMRAMLRHAKEHWGGRIRIESGSDAEKKVLSRIAAEQGVTIIEPTIPARPTPVTRRPAATAQARAAA
ncbi:MAG: LPD7 domain-containing protein [Alphaproteobacteria bacterium]|nr:LPD7 domain-containing protein [Alphaproteobacteria bacterium]